MQHAFQSETSEAIESLQIVRGGSHSNHVASKTEKNRVIPDANHLDADPTETSPYPTNEGLFALRPRPTQKDSPVTARQAMHATIAARSIALLVRLADPQRHTSFDPQNAPRLA